MDRYGCQIERLTTVKEAAVLLGLKECTVRLWMYRGLLGKVRLGRKAVRIPVADIVRLIEEGKAPASATTPPSSR